jgi:hypothetical protein
MHYLESGRGRYGVGKEGLRIRKIWTRLSLWKPGSLLSQGRSLARHGGARPKTPQRHKYNTLSAQWEVTIHIPPFYRRHSPENRRHRWGRELDEFVARINTNGGKEAIGGWTPSCWPRDVPKLHRCHLHRQHSPESPSSLCALILVRWWGNVSVHP